MPRNAKQKDVLSAYAMFRFLRKIEVAYVSLSRASGCSLFCTPLLSSLYVPMVGRQLILKLQGTIM